MQQIEPELDHTAAKAAHIGAMPMLRVEFLKDGARVGGLEILWPAWYLIVNGKPFGPFACREKAEQALWERWREFRLQRDLTDRPMVA